MAEKPTQQEVKVSFPENLRGGAYSNIMVVTHTKEEFVLDFMMVVPPAGSVTARVITSPGHLKRMISALTENLTKYESKFGKLTAAEEPLKPTIGFHPPPG
jgi:hypothetical protein